MFRQPSPISADSAVFNAGAKASQIGRDIADPLEDADDPAPEITEQVGENEKPDTPGTQTS